jgi:hypothetical protein
MPAVQTAYGTILAPAVAGMVANMETANSITRVLQTAAGMNFGVPAMRGTVDGTCKVSAAASSFLGVAILDPTKDGDKYAQYDNVSILTRGVIWVVNGSGGAATQGEPAYIVPATGVFTNVATANQLVGVFDSSGADAALVKLRLNG